MTGDNRLRCGAARGLEPRNKRQPTSCKKKSKERTKDPVRSANNNDDGNTKEKTEGNKQSTIIEK
jgi:hypothetical protein